MFPVSRLVGLLLLGAMSLGRPSFGQEESDSLPVLLNISTLQEYEQLCPPAAELETARAENLRNVRSALASISVNIGCGGSGWTRVTYLNLRDPTHECPSNWKEVPSPIRSCRRKSIGVEHSGGSCDSAFYPVGGLNYSMVCGRIVAYQLGSPDAFGSEDLSIDGLYVDGVSITHGNPREHVWSFTAALDERVRDHRVCPCTNVNNPTADFRIPSFVGDDYFCETGVPTGVDYTSDTFYEDDPLWDGSGCGPDSTCCSFNNPPWFRKELPQPTTDPIEVRLCGSDRVTEGEDTPVELIEIYVK